MARWLSATTVLFLGALLAVPLLAAELPGGHVLLREAVSDDGRTVAAFAPAGERCWTVRLFASRDGRWSAVADHPGPPRPRGGAECAPVVGVLAGNGRTVAVASPWEGSVTILDVAGARFVEAGRIALPGVKGRDFPNPGQLLAVQRDGGSILVGAPNYNCVIGVPEAVCGVAHLFVRRGARAVVLEDGRQPPPREARQPLVQMIDAGQIMQHALVDPQWPERQRQS